MSEAGTETGTHSLSGSVREKCGSELELYASSSSSAEISVMLDECQMLLDEMHAGGDDLLMIINNVSLADDLRTRETIDDNQVSLRPCCGDLPAHGPPVGHPCAEEQEMHYASFVDALGSRGVRLAPRVEMQSLEGLDARLDRLPGRKMPLECVKRVGMRLAEALADSTHLHLRPCFILLDEEDNVSLRWECQKTPGSLDATFNYSSPEALDPEMYGPLCTQSDVWSFACCVVEMTSGRPPWHGKEDAFKQFAHCFKSATVTQMAICCLKETPGDLPAGFRTARCTSVANVLALCICFRC